MPHPFGPGHGAGGRGARRGAGTGRPPEPPSAAEPAAPEPAPRSRTEAGAGAEPAGGGRRGAGGRGRGSGPRRRAPRDPLAAALIGVLTLLLGFAFAVQVRSVGDDAGSSPAPARRTSSASSTSSTRAEERLRDQIAEQRGALQELDQLRQPVGGRAGGGAGSGPRPSASSTAPSPPQGPGLVMTIRDPDGRGAGRRPARRHPGAARRRRGDDADRRRPRRGLHGGHRRARRPDGRRAADHRPVRVRGHRVAAGHGDGHEHPRAAWSSASTSRGGSVDDRASPTGSWWTRCGRSTRLNTLRPRPTTDVAARRPLRRPHRSRRRSPHGHARRPPLHRPARVGAGAGHRRRRRRVVRVGITDHAQDALGDIVFVQLPEVGDEVGPGTPIGEVESTKSVSDVYAPGRRRRGGRQRRRWPTPPRRSTPIPTARAGWSRSASPARAATRPATLLDAAAYQALVDAS